MRTRLAFGLLGAVGCLLAALLFEAGFRMTHLAGALENIGVSRILIFENDLERRLQEAGAHSGDVQIALSWNDTNDLDLSCTEPSGFDINFRASHLRSPTHGTLDVDQNRGEPYTGTPAEHIYWPRGYAPLGHYRVYVTYFARHGGPVVTPYRIQIRDHGHTRTLAGTLREWEPTHEVTAFDVETQTEGPLWIDPDFIKAALLVGFWGASLAAGFTLPVLFGLQWCYRRFYRERLLTRQDFGLTAGFALLCGFVCAAGAQALYALGPEEMRPEMVHLLRLVVFALLGGFLGLLLSLRIPHLPMIAALLAGLAGGWLGGIAYGVFADRAMAVGARLGAASMLGLAIGLMIQLILEREPEPEAETISVLQRGLKPQRLTPYRTRSSDSGGRKPH